MPKIDPKAAPPEELIWDLWTKDPNGDFRYLGRGTRAELAKFDDICEANGDGMHVLVRDPTRPPPEHPMQVVTLRPPYFDIRRGVVVKE
jgi:hypothetical protein